MKNIILFLTLFVSFSFFAQENEETLKSTFFTQKIVKKRGLQLVLVKVINDSRCPENVNCIWAGECEIKVATYKNRKLISTENVMISPKLYKENINWISKYYPNITIKSIEVMPYPKNEIVVNPKDFFVKIYYK